MYHTFLKPFYKDAKTFVLDTLFPIHCLGCNREGKFICEICSNDLSPALTQKCIVCQKPAASGLTHNYCIGTHTADGLISAFDYHDDRVARIIIHGKYFWLKGLYPILGRLMAKKLKHAYLDLINSSDWKLVPIPLHHFRKRWRGFNQAELLCETLSKELNLPISNMLIRKKSTRTQKDLKRADRLKNVANVFALSPELINNKLFMLNQNFLLIDDVSTTGATLSEAVKVLKANGAKKVICLTVARD